MFQEERQNKIVEIVSRRKSVKVRELSELFETSEATIRRDLEELDGRNRIIRTHGGAIAVYSVSKEISAPELISTLECIEEKKRISRRAYEEIQDYDTLILDSSSTVDELVKLIAAGDRRHLTIVTQTPRAVTYLENLSDCRVILLGGVFNYVHNIVEGPMATNAIRGLRADKCFIGINGIEPGLGYSTPRLEDAEMKALMIRSSHMSYLLADHTKFDRTYFARVDAEVDCIITDTRRSNVSYAWLEERTKLVFADEG